MDVRFFEAAALFFYFPVNIFNMRFTISVHVERKSKRFVVERVYVSDQIEKFKIIGRDRSITIQGNRPLLRARGLNSKKIGWKIIEGQMLNSSAIEEIIKTIDRYLKQDEFPREKFEKK